MLDLLQVTPLLPAVNLTVMGVQYALFSQIHHGFGLNDAFDRSVGMLQRRQQTTANASDIVLDHQDMTAQHSTVSHTTPKAVSRTREDQHEQLSLTMTPTNVHVGIVPDTTLLNITAGGAVTSNKAGRHPRGTADAQKAARGGQGVLLISGDVGQQDEQTPQGHQLAVTLNSAHSGQSTMLLSPHGEGQHNRRLAEAAAAAVEHPCLHAGYVGTYSTAGKAQPHNVTLTGRQGCCGVFHRTSLHGCLSGHAACSLLCSGSPGMPFLHILARPDSPLAH